MDIQKIEKGSIPSEEFVNSGDLRMSYFNTNRLHLSTILFQFSLNNLTFLFLASISYSSYNNGVPVVAHSAK